MPLIAFVHSSSHMSGVEFSTLYTVQALDRARWQPLVVCPQEGDLPRQCRAAGAEVMIVPRPRLFSSSVRIAGVPVINPFALLIDLWVLAVAARGVARALRPRRPALLVCKGLPAQFFGGLAARWLRIPCVWHVQDRVSERLGMFFPWTLSLAARAFACEVIADAETIARQVGTWYPRPRIRVIANGVNTREFSPATDGGAVRAEWHAASGDLLIGTIGRLTPWKGQRVLIEAFAQIADEFPRARVVLVGSALFESDAYARALAACAARRGLSDRVLFTGFRWDMPQVLSALDIVAHTALEKDSSPLAVVSALAAGKPVVCTQVDGTRQLFADGADGLLTPPGDAAALAAALRRLCSDPALRARLGAAARARAERDLGVEQFASRCAAVFARCARGAP